MVVNILQTKIYEKLNSAMMGLQANASKRKFEMGASEAGEIQASCPPAKAGRWSEEDSIAKLQAVAVPGEAWGPPTLQGQSPRSVLATTLLAAEDYDDDDEDFDDDYEDDDSAVANYLPLRGYCPRPYSPQSPLSGQGYLPKTNGAPYYGDYQQQQYCSRTPGQYSRPASYGWNQYGYYTPQEAASPQQTIRCAENGKSYLELGSASYGAVVPPNSPRGLPTRRCCDGRSWCSSRHCYRERRLRMMNLSMCKLARFRQCADPSLHRSVLICNTLRCIEREMENESLEPEPPQQHFPSGLQEPQTYESPLSYHNHRAATPAPQETPPNHYESALRDTSSSGRATPFPAGPDTDSGFGDEDSGRSINWGSVLSLSSQSALDPINNNDLFSSSPPWDYGLLDMDIGSEFTELLPSWKLTPLSADDILKSVSSPLEVGGRIHNEQNDMDNLTHILVSS